MSLQRILSSLVFLPFMLLASCGGKEKEVEVVSIAISQPSAEMEIGEILTLKATVAPSNATYDGITWTSTKPKVASVSNTGLVTALSEGNTTITVMAGGKTASCAITVVKGFVAVFAITLNKTTLELVEGNTGTLTASVSPEDATDKSVSWTSSNSGVATVTNGTVSAISEGESIITAKAGDKTATCKVIVQKKIINVTSISLDQTTAELFEGETLTLAATVLPQNATDKTITWKSSNASVADVDNGLVTAIKVGETTVSASAGDKTATCKVTVKQRPQVSSLKLSENSFNGYINQDYPISVTISPSNALYNLEWSSSETRVAELRGSGVLSKNIHTKDFGTTEITVKDIISGKSASITVKTIVTDFQWKENTGSTYSGYPLITINEGEEYQLHYSCVPSSATHLFEDLSNLVFYEPNYVVETPSVITISAEGKVTGVKPGTIGIKPTGRLVKGSSGNDRVYISVKSKTIPVSGIYLNKSSLSMYVGGSGTLTATVLPENATDKTVTWTSSNTSIVTVNDGVVSAVSEGEATITASAGDKTATCKVTVSQRPLVSSLILSTTSSFNAYINQEYPISVTVLPADAQYDLEWSSSNTRVAEVQGSGLSRRIYTKDFGKTVVTIKDKISGKSESVTVQTVVTNFEWKENTGNTYNGYPLVTIEVGEEYQLNYSCSPSSATRLFEDFPNSNWVVYRSSSVVYSVYEFSITPGGKITGLMSGIIGIKPTGSIIRGSNGPERIYIQVKPKTIAVSEVRLNKTSLSLNVGDSETIIATVLPDNATDKTVTWKSSNSSVATVDSNGKVTAISAGSATIMATSGGVSSSCSVTVSIPVSSVTLNKTTLKLTKGKNETLVATVNPSDASDKTVVWSSSNTSVATVDQSGKVVAVAEGSSQIMVTTKDGGKTATCGVTVLPPGNTEPINDDGQYHGWD